MDYFAGLDISMDETHVCVLEPQSHGGSREQDEVDCASGRRRTGESTKLSSDRLRDRTDDADPFSRVEPAWSPGGLRREPDKPPRHSAWLLPPTRPIAMTREGWRRSARTGFFKPVHVKSLQAHALRSLIIARKKLVGQRVTLENQIRGLAVVFGVRLPRALTECLHR